MATTPIIEATTAAVAGEDADFTTTTRGFWLYGSGFGKGEFARVEGLGADGATYETKTNENGPIHVTANPNTVFVDLPAGTYRIAKMATAVAAGVAFEEAA